MNPWRELTALAYAAYGQLVDGRTLWETRCRNGKTQQRGFSAPGKLRALRRTARRCPGACERLPPCVRPGRRGPGAGGGHGICGLGLGEKVLVQDLIECPWAGLREGRQR